MQYQQYNQLQNLDIIGIHTDVISGDCKDVQDFGGGDLDLRNSKADEINIFAKQDCIKGGSSKGGKGALSFIPGL